MSTVRENLMYRKGYTPYCGNHRACTMPRTEFNGEQFVCPDCSWVSSFEEEFIQRYKVRWDLNKKNLNKTYKAKKIGARVVSKKDVLRFFHNLGFKTGYKEPYSISEGGLINFMVGFANNILAEEREKEN